MQVFHPNSKPQICHDLTLKIISHQIKDNMHNHGSIGLLGSWIFGGKFGLLGVLTFPFSISLFLFGFGAEQQKIQRFGL